MFHRTGQLLSKKSVLKFERALFWVKKSYPQLLKKFIFTKIKKAPKKLNNEAITIEQVKSLLPAARKTEIGDDISKVKLGEWYNYADFFVSNINFICVKATQAYVFNHNQNGSTFKYT